MDELLIKYLLGEASREEEQEAQNWINASTANQKHFYHIQKIWEESRKLESKTIVDEHKAWQKFQKRIDTDGHTLPSVRSTRKLWQITSAAAVILFAGIFYYFFHSNSNQVIIAAGNQVRVDTLSDGSVVTLNKNAILTLTGDFNKARRNVTLIGEAFFHVTRNKTKPFIVKTGAVSIQVIGTSFNVKQTTDVTEVIVETGIVQVEKKANRVQLLPHEKATVYRKSAAPIVERNKDQLYNYYRTAEFVCNNTPLWKLVSVLNEAYDAKIIITNKEIRNLTLTTTFQHIPLQEILDILTRTLNIEQTEDGETIILK